MAGGMVGVDGEDVLVDVVPVRVMQMPVVEVVDMAVVQHRGVPAAGTVDVVVI